MRVWGWWLAFDKVLCVGLTLVADGGIVWIWYTDLGKVLRYPMFLADICDITWLGYVTHFQQNIDTHSDIWLSKIQCNTLYPSEFL